MPLHRSPALTAIYNEIKNSDRNQVLELGPMSKGCFQLFSELSCKIHVEDLSSCIRDHIRSGQPLNDFKVEENLIDYKKDEKFDVILAWDLLNYLDLHEIKRLFAVLRPHCKPNTLLYMLRYVEKNIPVSPRDILVKDKYLLEMTEEGFEERALPNYGTLQILSSLPGYFLQDTLMGQTGMMPGITEHVLRFSSSNESRHLISKSESARVSIKQNNKSDGEQRIHLSPSVAEVVSLLQSDDNFVVLDLASSANRPEDLIVERAGAYYRIDIFSLIERSRSKNIENLNLSVLDYKISRKFDVILTWDLFNYCTPLQIVQLNKALSLLSHENTFLLSFMNIGRNLPEKPSKFEVVDGNKVIITPTTDTLARKDSITGASLLRLLDTFTMDNTYAYREGMDREIIEYIFAANENCTSSVLAQSS